MVQLDTLVHKVIQDMLDQQVQLLVILDQLVMLDQDHILDHKDILGLKVILDRKDIGDQRGILVHLVILVIGGLLVILHRLDILDQQVKYLGLQDHLVNLLVVSDIMQWWVLAVYLIENQMIIVCNLMELV